MVKATLEVVVVMIVVVGFAHALLRRVAGQMTKASKYGQSSNNEDSSHDLKLRNGGVRNRAPFFGRFGRRNRYNNGRLNWAFFFFSNRTRREHVHVEEEDCPT